MRCCGRLQAIIILVFRAFLGNGQSKSKFALQLLNMNPCGDVQAKFWLRRFLDVFLELATQGIMLMYRRPAAYSELLVRVAVGYSSIAAFDTGTQDAALAAVQSHGFEIL